MLRAAPRRRSWTVAAVVAVVALVAGLAVGALVAPDRTARYMQVVHELDPAPTAPTHEPDVIAAGWHACGDLARGGQPAELVAEYARDGIGGDLYTLDGVKAVVTAAQRALCGT